MAKPGTLTIEWTDSGIEFVIDGTEVNAKLWGSTIKNCPYMSVYVDDVRKNTFAVKMDDVSYQLCSNLTPGRHTIKLIKISEASFSYVNLYELSITGKLLEKPSNTNRKIEFIGDSITCGLGNLSTAPFSSATEDGMQTWAAVAAQKLSVDFNVFSASGYGVVRDNGGGNSGLIPLIYDKANPFSGSSQTIQVWDFNKFQPDAVVINLGTNDWAARAPVDEFKTGVKNFISLIRQKNPNAQIIWAYGLMITGYGDYIEQTVNEISATDNKVHYVQLLHQTSAGGAGHPSVDSHINSGEKFADDLKVIMGW